jgi:hypothetical protein
MRLLRSYCLLLVMLTPAACFAQNSLPLNLEIGLPTQKAIDSDASTAISNSCQLDKILPHVTKHVREFVENVNRFTAREVLERERLDRGGKIKEQAHSRSNYVATIEEPKKGFFMVEEYRNETHGVQTFNGTITANVAPALELIFHPLHIGEYEMSCEGPVGWNGQSTWRIRFEQRMDRPATISSFIVNGTEFTMLIKGSAWVDSRSYQILHLEADLLSPVTQVRLEMLHQSVDYGPVTFGQRDTTLWLPMKADVTADFQGKLLVERHMYSDFQLFSVETGQKVKNPKE